MRNRIRNSAGWGRLRTVAFALGIGVAMHMTTPSPAPAGAHVTEPLHQLEGSGIPAAQFQPFYREQLNSAWCWAACIEMVLDYAGPNVNQPAIVRQVYGAQWNGAPPDAPASFAHVQSLLNQWGVDDDGDRFWVQARGGFGAPPPGWLLGELGGGHPIIVLFHPFGPQMGHFVVITGAYYQQTPHGPLVQRLVIWDPFPYFKAGAMPPPYYAGNGVNPGRFEVPADVFMSTASYHIFTRAADDRGFRWPTY